MFLNNYIGTYLSSQIKCPKWALGVIALFLTL